MASPTRVVPPYESSPASQMKAIESDKRAVYEVIKRGCLMWRCDVAVAQEDQVVTIIFDRFTHPHDSLLALNFLPRLAMCPGVYGIEVELKKEAATKCEIFVTVNFLLPSLAGTHIKTEDIFSPISKRDTGKFDKELDSIDPRNMPESWSDAKSVLKHMASIMMNQCLYIPTRTPGFIEYPETGEFAFVIYPVEKINYAILREISIHAPLTYLSLAPSNRELEIRFRPKNDAVRPWPRFSLCTPSITGNKRSSDDGAGNALLQLGDLDTHYPAEPKRARAESLDAE